MDFIEFPGCYPKNLIRFVISESGIEDVYKLAEVMREYLSRWDVAEPVDLLKQIEDMKGLLGKQTGYKPNTLVISRSMYSHFKWLDILDGLKKEWNVKTDIYKSHKYKYSLKNIFKRFLKWALKIK